MALLDIRRVVLLQLPKRYSFSSVVYVPGSSQANLFQLNLHPNPHTLFTLYYHSHLENMDEGKTNKSVRNRATIAFLPLVLWAYTTPS